MFGIGMPELMVIAVVALLVVGPKKLPEIAKALGKGLAEFRKVTESATDTLKETLKTDELKKEMDGFKDSLLNNEGEKEAAVPSAVPNLANHDTTKMAEPKAQV
jgi:Tat protein translocase TatB subunit